MKTLSLKNLSPEDAFDRFLWLSFAIHVILFFGVMIKNVILPSREIRIENAVRVDVVALPDKLPERPAPVVEEKTPPKPAPTAAPAKPEPQKPDAVSLKKDVKKAQQEALNRLRQREALERLKQQAQEAPPVKKKNLYAGNQLSQGDSITGLERIAFDEYLSELKQRVHNNFTIPTWLANAPLKASVEVVIDENGKIIKMTLVKSSGNPTFDGAATSAVESSAPFPPVPERLTRTWGSFTIQFNFPDY